ncbi:MAG: HD domain-containing protein [Clostridia bacterium]|nr:HD domain-containing protein [Clostridia bacterium]
MKNKIIRDSVHGYISIPEPIVDKLIDTEFFQRLRRIEQTSMRPLFPCARHDRFIHSIGVYYLGGKVFDSVKSNFQKNKESLFDVNDAHQKDLLTKMMCDFSFWDDLRINFIIACLLHDVGHSPMSHTLEDQFKVKQYSGSTNEFKGMPQFWEELESGMNNCMIDNCRQKVVDFFKSGIPAPHEVLSSIIVVKELRDNIKEAIYECCEKCAPDYEFIIRCIMGVPYTISQNDDKWFNDSLKNAFISLLHGTVFDVDRLDYLKRDSLASGMDSSSIDVERLINAISLYFKNNFFGIAINKSALSVIDEHIGAYNDLYLWVYSHHKVVLLTGLTRRAFEHIDKNSMSNSYYISNIFNYKSLTLNLLSDDDIWCEIKKQKCGIWEAAELITRGNSLISMWKSVAEFRDLFGNLGAFLEDEKGVVPIKTIYSQINSTFEKNFTKMLFEKYNLDYSDSCAQDVIFEKTKIKEMSRKKWTIPIIIDNHLKLFSELMNVNHSAPKTIEKEREKERDSLNEICFYAYIKKDSKLNSIKKEDFARLLIEFVGLKKVD